jgi:hypothetical protein
MQFNAQKDVPLWGTIPSSSIPIAALSLAMGYKMIGASAVSNFRLPTTDFLLTSDFT